MEKDLKKEIENAIETYKRDREKYVALMKKVKSIIGDCLKEEGILVHTIQGRTKTLKSFSQKIENPKYEGKMERVQDLVGIRIITYVKSDVQKVNEVIKDNFEIDEDNSGDKSEILGTDKVGYRSVHYVAGMHSDRLKLPEYGRFKGLVFEIQVRTILEHAWAEIEHDRAYKFSGELPDELMRRFKVLSGALELADNEFNSIAQAIDDYSIEVKQKSEEGNLSIPIDSISLKTYLDNRLTNFIGKFPVFPEFGWGSSSDNDKGIMEELREMGIFTLDQLEKSIPRDFRNQFGKFFDESSSEETYSGILRTIMIVINPERYFEKAWKKKWNEIDMSTVKLAKVYHPNIEKIIQDYDVDMEIEF